MSETPSHDQPVTHSYHIRFPAHEPRRDDPHYKLFEAYRRAHVGSAVCAVGARGPEFKAECAGGLELHHRIVEFAVLNAVDLKTFIKDYPDVSDEAALQTWAESAPNFEFLCTFHHRGHGGVHVASASDFEAEQYVPGLIS